MSITRLATPLAARIGLGIIGLLLIFVAIQTYRVSTAQRGEERAVAALKAERAAHVLFAERVRAKAEEISRRFADNARRVEADQERVSQEVSRDYQIRLAALRAEYERRLRHSPGGANPGGARPAPGVPAVPGPAGGADGAAAAFDFACRANTLTLEFLQEWVRRQVAVPREPVAVD